MSVTFRALRSGTSCRRSAWRSRSSSRSRGGREGAPAPSLRQPPVPTAKDGHQRGYEDRAHDRRVDEDPERESQPELLQPGNPAGDEARESGHHDQGRGGDDAAGALEPVRDRTPVVGNVLPRLAHAGYEEHLVVHREAEEHREEEDRDPALDLRRVVETEQRG